MARSHQGEILNDPFLRTFVEFGKKVPLVDLVKYAKNQMVEPIEIPPANQATTKKQDQFTEEEKAIEDKKRKGIVAEAKRMKSPTTTWKEIASKLEVPERTLRDWRHNTKYQ